MVLLLRRFSANFFLGFAEMLKLLVELANTGIFPDVPGVWEG